MSWSAFLLAIFALLALPVKGSLAHDLMIVNVAVPASLTPGATSGIIYFTVMNHGPEDDKLVSVSTPVATSAMLHESYQDGDVAKMRMLPDVDIPPGGFVKLEQGGKHVMLTGLTSPLKKGDKITVTVTFEKAGPLRVEATVGDPVTGQVPSE